MRRAAQRGGDAIIVIAANQSTCTAGWMMLLAEFGANALAPSPRAAAAGSDSLTLL